MRYNINTYVITCDINIILKIRLELLEHPKKYSSSKKRLTFYNLNTKIGRDHKTVYPQYFTRGIVLQTNWIPCIFRP